MATRESAVKGPAMDLDPGDASSDGVSATQDQSEPSAAPETSKPNPIFELFRLRGTNPSEDDLKALAHQAVMQALEKEALVSQYNLVFLYDLSSLQQNDADRIYGAVTSISDNRPVLLLLHSNGGNISAAYFISKLCRETSPEKFIAAVPRRAKSAATLICWGQTRYIWAA